MSDHLKGKESQENPLERVEVAMKDLAQASAEFESAIRDCGYTLDGVMESKECKFASHERPGGEGPKYEISTDHAPSLEVYRGARFHGLVMKSKVFYPHKILESVAYKNSQGTRITQLNGDEVSKIDESGVHVQKKTDTPTGIMAALKQGIGRVIPGIVTQGGKIEEAVVSHDELIQSAERMAKGFRAAKKLLSGNKA